MRKLMLAGACLAAVACPNKSETEIVRETAFVDIPPPTTTSQPPLTTEPEPVTTTTAPEPVLCARLPHPAHHSACPPAPAENLRVQTTIAAASRSSSASLASIRACESGSNYSTDTGNGYYGAYQFAPSTWASVGGSGNPADASASEQDMRAQMMIDAGRRGEWPSC